jgi:hypothetical protein
MTYSNPLLVELVVPQSTRTNTRLRGFYEAIGWDVVDDTESEGYTYVRPRVMQGMPPTVVYGQNPDPAKTSFFIDRQEPNPSTFALGPSMPFPFDLVEICMAVPSDEDVQALYEQGGELLAQHIQVPLREYYGVQEFRFIDPFNYVIRVTANPGWETYHRNVENN